MCCNFSRVAGLGAGKWGLRKLQWDKGCYITKCVGVVWWPVATVLEMQCCGLTEAGLVQD